MSRHTALARANRLPKRRKNSGRKRPPSLEPDGKPTVNARFARAVYESGTSQAALGEFCGVTQAQISKLSRPGSIASPTLAKKLEEAIGFPASAWAEADRQRAVAGAKARWAEEAS